MANAAGIVQGHMTCIEVLHLSELLNTAMPLSTIQQLSQNNACSLHDIMLFLCEANEGFVALPYCMRWV